MSQIDELEREIARIEQEKTRRIVGIVVCERIQMELRDMLTEIITNDKPSVSPIASFMGYRFSVAKGEDAADWVIFTEPIQEFYTSSSGMPHVEWRFHSYISPEFFTPDFWKKFGSSGE